MGSPLAGRPPPAHSAPEAGRTGVILLVAVASGCANRPAACKAAATSSEQNQASGLHQSRSSANAAMASKSYGLPEFSPSQRLPKISDRALESLREVGRRLPSELGSGQRQVGLALPRIVGRQRLEDDPALRARQPHHLFGKLQDRELPRVADVD